MTTPAPFELLPPTLGDEEQTQFNEECKVATCLGVSGAFFILTGTAVLFSFRRCTEVRCNNLGEILACCPTPFETDCYDPLADVNVTGCSDLDIQTCPGDAWRCIFVQRSGNSTNSNWKRFSVKDSGETLDSLAWTAIFVGLMVWTCFTYATFKSKGCRGRIK